MQMFHSHRNTTIPKRVIPSTRIKNYETPPVARILNSSINLVLVTYLWVSTGMSGDPETCAIPHGALPLIQKALREFGNWASRDAQRPPVAPRCDRHSNADDATTRRERRDDGYAEESTDDGKGSPALPRTQPLERVITLDALDLALEVGLFAFLLRRPKMQHGQTPLLNLANGCRKKSSSSGTSSTDAICKARVRLGEYSPRSR